MSKERLKKAIQSLPLDEKQLDSALAGVARLDEDKAEIIANQIEEGLAELPDAISELRLALAKTK